MFKKSEVWFGIISGLLMPLVGIFLVRITFFPNQDINKIMEFFLMDMDTMSDVLALSLLVNGGIFYLFLKYDKEESARGVVLSTFLWGIVCVCVKFCV